MYENKSRFSYFREPTSFLKMEKFLKIFMKNFIFFLFGKAKGMKTCQLFYWIPHGEVRTKEEAVNAKMVQKP